METELTSRDNVLTARQAVDAYRQAHLQLHRSRSWHEGIPAEHTALLEQLIKDLELIGYKGTGKNVLARAPGVLKQTFDCSRELNVKDLGFTDTADFNARRTRSDEEALEEMWH